MKKIYGTPSVQTNRLRLGVFGDYGQPDGGNDVDPVPIKIISRHEVHLD